MKFPKVFSLLAAILVLSTVAACASRSDNAVNAVNGGDSIQDSSASRSTAQVPATETNQTEQAPQTTAASQRPNTKTETISVEGEATPVTLKLFEEASSVFTTYYPEEDFIAESGGSGEGTGTRFYFNAGGTKNENVYVRLFFPAQATTLEQINKLVTQERGLLQSNQWKVVERTDEVLYSWAKEKIIYQQNTGSEPIGGEVYIGEANGKAFYVVTHYPMEYAEGFRPRADLILKNLEVTQ